jgi:hypothetical protein
VTTAQASAQVLRSGTVGPLAITSSGLPTTSLSTSVTSVAGLAARASWPPLTRLICLRRQLIALIVAPHASSASVVACKSARVRPAGASSSAEPPPDSNTITRSSAPALSSKARMRRPASSPAWFGIGCAASMIATRAVGAACPVLTTTRPPLIAAPNTSSTARAIGAPALPAPTTRTRRKRFRSYRCPSIQSSWSARRRRAHTA